MLESCTLIGNAGFADEGGAIDAISGSEITLLSSVVAGNFADDPGVALASDLTSTYTVVSCTLSGNGEDRALFDGDGKVTIRNSIVWGHQVPLVNGEPTQVEVSFSCVEGDSVIPGEGNINQDPLFVSQGRFDFSRCRTIERDGIAIAAMDAMQSLFETIQEECTRPNWSRGVQLARANAVSIEERNDDEITLCVSTRGGLVAPPLFQMNAANHLRHPPAQLPASAYPEAATA